MDATQMAHPLSGELRTFKKDMFDCQMCIAASTERSIVASQEIPVGSVGMAYTQPAQEDLFQPVSTEGRQPGFDGGFELVMSFSQKWMTDSDRNRNFGKISDRIPTDYIPSHNLTEI